MATNTWLESGGGPLIVLPRLLVSEWHGVPVDSPTEIAGDYARAVNVTEYIGMVSVGNGHGLVLGGDPLPATIHESLNLYGVVIVRWVYAESDEEAEIAWQEIPESEFALEEFLFESASDELVMFDAAFAGLSTAREERIASIAPGIYAVQTAEWKPDEHTFLIVHRLQRL